MSSNTLYAICLGAYIMCEWGLSTHSRRLFFIRLVFIFLRAAKQAYEISDNGENPTHFVYGGMEEYISWCTKRTKNVKIAIVICKNQGFCLTLKGFFKI